MNPVWSESTQYFIKDRNECCDTRLLIHIIHHLITLKMPEAVVSVDAEKAFDGME